MADSQKTEKATPKKRRDERKKGHVFFSNDAVSVVTLVGGFALLWAFGPGIVQRLKELLYYCLSLAAGLPDGNGLRAQEALMAGLKTLATTVGPLLAVTALLALSLIHI